MIVYILLYCTGHEHVVLFVIHFHFIDAVDLLLLACLFGTHFIPETATATHILWRCHRQHWSVIIKNA